MRKIGFDNDQYVRLQSERIRQRINKFGGKLYLEFGGKLFDDYHASRVLPGFLPDSKMKVLLQLKDQAEIVIAINAAHIEMNKRRGDLGITYDLDVMRLIDTFRSIGLYVGSVVITQYAGQHAADLFQRKLEALGVKVYRHYPIADYPSNINLIVSDEGYGRNEYIETSRPIVIVTAPGPGSGKMATCLSQLYQEHKRGVNAGYAKYETFPIWTLPLKHPVNLAYEAATADLADVNMIDPFHLEAYGETTVNYNRDIFAELICDSRGIHVDPYMLRLVRRIKGDDRIILISDVYVADGPVPEEFAGVTDINFDHSGEIAGSNLTLEVACRNMMKHTGASMVDVFNYASYNPARVLGMTDRGEIAVGKRADLVAVDHRMNVQKVFFKGELQ